MKKTILISALALLVSSSLFAQEAANNPEVRSSAFDNSFLLSQPGTFLAVQGDDAQMVLSESITQKAGKSAPEVLRFLSGRKDSATFDVAAFMAARAKKVNTPASRLEAEKAKGSKFTCKVSSEYTKAQMVVCRLISV